MVSILIKNKKKTEGKEKSFFDICNLNWILSKHFDKPLEPIPSLSLIDLFSGCGGMTLGVREALKANDYDLDIKLAVDIDEEAMKVYKRNFHVNNKIALNKNITEFVTNKIGQPFDIKEKEISKKYKNLDILVAGPPCQGHSNLNNHTRRNDPRNDLYLNAIRFVEILKPKIAIIENVSTVIHDKEDVVNKSKIVLEGKGYQIFSIIINTSKFGIAQSRKRHFQIALLDSNLNMDLSTFVVKKPLLTSDYIQDLTNEYLLKKGIFYTPSKTKETNRKRIDYLFENNLYDLPDHVRPDCHKTKNHSYKSCYGRIHWDGTAQTITSGFGSMGQGRFVHPLVKRVITPHEAARLQGFPDFFKFTQVQSRTDLHRMIANAVPPKIIAIIICHLFNNKLFNDAKRK